MPFYHRLGEIPHKRHTQFKKPDGKLYREELMGLEGFSSIQSLLYHQFLPPRSCKTEDLGSRKPEVVDFGPIRHRAFKTAEAPAGTDPVSARIPLLSNNDVTLGICRATKSMDYFYRNAQAYETWWVHEGSGTLKTQFGNLPFHEGDYIVIPFGTTWQMMLADPGGALLHDRESLAARTPQALSQRVRADARARALLRTGHPRSARRWRHTRNAARSKCASRCAIT